LAEWFSEIDWSDKFIPDLIIYVLSFFCLALIPASFKKMIWVVLLWFVGINVLFFFNLVPAFNWRNPIVFIALGQAPWILVALDLIFKGRLSPKVETIPLQSMILWQTTRIMSIHFFLSLFGGLTPPTFSGPVALSEIVTGLGAIVLYFKFNPESNLYRTLLIFWNTYGLTSILSAEYRIFLSNPHHRFYRGDGDIFSYITSYPQSWCYCFWFPIAIGMHAALYYKLYQVRTRKIPI